MTTYVCQRGFKVEKPDEYEAIIKLRVFESNPPFIRGRPYTPLFEACRTCNKCDRKTVIPRGEIVSSRAKYCYLEVA